MSNSIAETLPGLNGYIESLQQLESQLIGQCDAIEAWFKSQWLESPAPFYGSVDLRNAGYKLAPVDMNLFPAGFNNLNPDFLSVAAEAASAAMKSAHPKAKSILLIPENHTRNLYYWASIHTLCQILETAGFTVQIGSLLPDDSRPQRVTLLGGVELPLLPLKRVGGSLQAGDVVSDVIVLNNDLSEGIPEILQNLSQPVLPPPELGWSHRLKSGHFQYYADVSAEFAELTGIDPWLIAPFFRHCGEVDFMHQEGIDCLVRNAHALFAAIRQEFTTRRIESDPFVVMKADAGTYGMGVMTLRNVDELQSLNRKERTRMAKTKSGQPVHQVILQEGVYTFETVGPEDAVAEPVVYLMGERVIGGFYRVHKGRGTDENLNTPGMEFEPLPFIEPCHLKRSPGESGPCGNRFYLYGLVARLSMLAAARELREQQK